MTSSAELLGSGYHLANKTTFGWTWLVRAEMSLKQGEALSERNLASAMAVHAAMPERPVTRDEVERVTQAS
jgi:hypothetical protein